MPNIYNLSIKLNNTYAYPFGFFGIYHLSTSIKVDNFTWFHYVIQGTDC